MKALTARQAAVLKFLSDYKSVYGYPPTLREIGAHFDIRSTNGVNDHLRALERKGHIQRDPFLSRSILIVRNEEGEHLFPNEVLFRVITKKLIRAGVNSDTLCEIKAVFEAAQP